MPDPHHPELGQASIQRIDIAGRAAGPEPMTNKSMPFNRLEHENVRKRPMESRENGSQGRRSEAIGLDPLREHTSAAETGSAETKEVLREEIRRDGHPRVRRLGDDDVVVRRIELELVARVVDRDGHAWVVEHIVVVALEPASGFEHRASTSTTRMLPTGCVAVEPTVIPVARPTINTSRGAEWKSRGDVPCQDLGLQINTERTRRSFH